MSEHQKEIFDWIDELRDMRAALENNGIFWLLEQKFGLTRDEAREVMFQWVWTDNGPQPWPHK